MKIYIIVKNEYCINEYDDYLNEAVYLSKEKAEKECEKLNKELSYNRGANGLQFGIDTYEVLE